MLKIVELKTDAELSPANGPTVSLSLTVRSARSPSTLLSVGSHVDEVVVVLAIAAEHREQWITTLDTNPLLRDKIKTVIEVDPQTHPHLYEPDLPATFQLGNPLGDETYRGTATGKMFVSDWSAVRNLGWTRCSQEWRLALYDDENLDHPECLRDLCRSLDSHNRDVAYGSSSRDKRCRYAARLSRNFSGIRFEGSARESLEGGLRPTIVEGILSTRTTSASPSDLATECSETFRTLYAEARARSWDVPLSNLLHLAQTSRHADMEPFAPLAVKTYLDNSLFPEERAWACAIRGEIYENASDLHQAAAWYEISLAEHPGWKSALRLARIRFHQKQFQECLAAYDTAVENNDHHHLCDDGDESWNATLLYVAVALHETGKKEAAKLCCQKLRETYPNSPQVADLCRTIG
jgi:tetratricopeptide (TPR) repeat protein